jgi:hypothetical protein
MVSKNTLERIWKEGVMDIFGVLPRYLPGETKENYKKFSSDSYYPSRYSCRIFRECKSEYLPLKPTLPLTTAVS